MTAESIYARAPIWLQNCLVSLRGWEYRFRRASDGDIHRHLEFLLKTQWWSLEQFREYQTHLLQETLREAFRGVPYYRTLRQQLSCEPEDFKGPEDLRKLPILEKTAVRNNEDQFLNPRFTSKGCTQGFTSGTTGTPLRLFEGREAFSRRWAFVARLRSWAGCRSPVHPRRVQFTGRNIVPNSQHPGRHAYWRFNGFSNSLLCSTTHLGQDTVPYYVRKLCRFRPEVIEGYPSAILILARVARGLQLPLPRPKSINVSAETFSAEDREELERAFGCRVFNQYAASEPSCFWCDCEHGVMHVNPEYGISEIVDANGAHVSVGQEGDVVVTSCLNPAMPLIRYRLGDTAVLGPATRCACGREMPRIIRVTGRRDDMLFIPERGYVGRLDPAFKGLRNIIEAQIVQEGLDDIRVRLVPDANYDPGSTVKLIANLRAKLGMQVRITVELVNRIPRGPNGKFRSVVSNVRSQYPEPI
jgi:phenylacetate-CoA ligase